MKNKLITISVVVFVVSLFFRILFINNYPSTVINDSADTLTTYLRFKNDNKFNLFDFNWNGAPAFNPYIIGISWELLNRSVVGYRLPSVLFGSLTVLTAFLIYFIISKSLLFSFLVAINLSFNTIFLNFSREGWENIFNAFFINIIILGILLIFKKVNKTLGYYFITIGSILGFYGYHPGKIFILISLTLVFYLSYRLKNFKSLFIIFVLFIFFALPQLISTYKNQPIAFGRIKAVSVFNLKNPIQYIGNNLKKNISAFIFLDNESLENVSYLNDRYLPKSTSIINKGFLLFYLLGIIFSLFNDGFLFYIFILSLFPIEILSIDTPDIARAIHVIPIMYAFVGLGFSWLTDLIKSNKIKLIYLFISTIFLITISIFELVTYFKWINSPETNFARQPHILNKDFKKWSNLIEKDIKRGNYGFNVGEWNTIINR